MDIIAYKVLVDGKSTFRGHRWTRAWMPPVEPALCDSGYHASQGIDVLGWLEPGCDIYEVQLRGKIIEGVSKIVAAEARLVQRLRWDDQIARLVACDCAEHVVHLCGDDPRPREAIRVARRYALGLATDAELRASAVAARYAAREAAKDAAKDAAFAASAVAAWDAARAAARVAEAAWDAEAAARARGDARYADAVAWAARYAAVDAARYAREAARKAEHAWQSERLRQWLYGERTAEDVAREMEVAP